jgi:hypothetical protein
LSGTEKNWKERGEERKGSGIVRIGSYLLEKGKITKDRMKALIGGVMGALLLIFFFPFHSPKEEVERVLVKTMITYGTIRMVNRIASALKETDLKVNAVIIEGKAPVGAIFDPLDDATERLSLLLTISIWVLGAEWVFFQIFPIHLIGMVGLAVFIILLVISPLRGRWWDYLLKGALALVWLPIVTILSIYLVKGISDYLSPLIGEWEGKLKSIFILPNWSSLTQLAVQLKEIVNRLNMENIGIAIDSLIHLGSFYFFQLVVEIGVPVVAIWLVFNTIWRWEFE